MSCPSWQCIELEAVGLQFEPTGGALVMWPEILPEQ